MTRETMTYKRERLKTIEDTLEVDQLIEQLLCVNAPLLSETLFKLKNLLFDKSTLIFFRNEPLIMFHGVQ